MMKKFGCNNSVLPFKYPLSLQYFVFYETTRY